MGKDEIDALQRAISHAHKCGSVHIASVGVHEMDRGKVVWDGNVEIFSLAGHPQAQQCYAWSQRRADGTTEVVVILKLPPVTSPQEAVRTYLQSRPQK